MVPVPYHHLPTNEMPRPLVPGLPPWHAGGSSVGKPSAKTRRTDDRPHSPAANRTFYANCHDWHRLCRAGVRCLLRRLWPPSHLRGHGQRQDRGAATRRDSDLRTRPRCAGRGQCDGRAAGFCHRPDQTRGGRRCGVHRGRHAVSTGRRPRRPQLRSCRRARDRRGAFRLYGGDHQVDRPGRHRRRGGAADF